jgi:hypothetical protein
MRRIKTYAQQLCPVVHGRLGIGPLGVGVDVARDPLGHAAVPVVFLADFRKKTPTP